MANELVLVTGAAGGRQGQTGRHVSQMLLARGVPVRAFVHRIDERSHRLRTLGAEVFEGDFLDIASVQRAVKGVASIYFAYPVQDGLLDATATMAVAARNAGISRLVDLVMLRSSPDAPTPPCGRTTCPSRSSGGLESERHTSGPQCSTRIYGLCSAQAFRRRTRSVSPLAATARSSLSSRPRM